MRTSKILKRLSDERTAIESEIGALKARLETLSSVERLVSDEKPKFAKKKSVPAPLQTTAP